MAIIRERAEIYEEGEEQQREMHGLLVERRDPYGYWYVVKTKNPKLQGAYTTLDKLEAAIIAWHVNAPNVPNTPKKVPEKAQ